MSMCYNIGAYALALPMYLHGRVALSVLTTYALFLRLYKSPLHYESIRRLAENYLVIIIKI